MYFEGVRRFCLTPFFLPGAKVPFSSRKLGRDSKAVADPALRDWGRQFFLFLEGVSSNKLIPFFRFSQLQDIPLFERDNTSELVLSEVEGKTVKDPALRDWGRQIISKGYIKL